MHSDCAAKRTDLKERNGRFDLRGPFDSGSWAETLRLSSHICLFPSSSLLVKRPVVRKHAGGILKSDLKRGQAEAAVICS